MPKPAAAEPAAQPAEEPAPKTSPKRKTRKTAKRTSKKAASSRTSKTASKPASKPKTTRSSKATTTSKAARSSKASTASKATRPAKKTRKTRATRVSRATRSKTRIAEPAPKPITPRIRFDLEDSLVEAVLRGDEPAALQLLRESLEDARLASNARRNPRHSLVILNTLLRRNLQDYHANPEAVALHAETWDEAIRDLPDDADLFDMTCRMVAEYCVLASHGTLAQYSTRVANAVAFIYGHLETPGLTLQMVATAQKLSVSHMSHLFNEEVGISFPEFLARERIRRAKRLLTDGREHKLADIAYTCGFDVETSFSRTFRRIARCSPTEYRNRQAHVRYERRLEMERREEVHRPQGEAEPLEEDVLSLEEEPQVPDAKSND